MILTEMVCEGRQWTTLKSMLSRPLLLGLVVGSVLILLAIPQLPDVKLYTKVVEVKSKLERSENDTADQSIPLPKTESAIVIDVDQRRRLAATIIKVQRNLQRLAGTKAVIDAKWPLKLAAVAAELDPRISSPTVSAIWDQSARLPVMGPAPQVLNKTRHVCPEVYDIKNGEPYWINNMKPENCTYIPKIKEVITAILPATEWESGQANFVVQQIRKYYDIPIIVILSPNDRISEDLNISIIKHDWRHNESKTINNVIQTVETPFVFMGLSLSHFDRQASLDRLVRVLDDLGSVQVAGGAARDLQGRWIHGCLQVRMAYYQAYYAPGYYYSKYECMYCDDILTSFMTTKRFLIDTPLTTELRGPALYRDWFAKVRQKGQLVVACPDVMFYVDKHTAMNKGDWVMFAKKWELQKIHSHDEIIYNFTCDEAGISCEKPLDHIKSYLLPPCCAAVMEYYTTKLTDYGERHNLTYEFHAGSVLGAVKMGSYLPWDFDMDLYYHCKDYNKWLKMEKEFNKEKCRIWIAQKGVYFTLSCPYFFIELYCHKKLSAELELPKEYQNTSTTIKYAGHDVKVIANPGSYSRNKMGFDDLKHAAHWRTLKVSTESKAKGGYDHPGSWNNCTNPKHHSCLDHFPGDGNLPFLEPFLLM